MVGGFKPIHIIRLFNFNLIKFLFLNETIITTNDILFFMSYTPDPALDKRVRKYTGWNSMEEMARNSPTLRTFKGMSVAERGAITEFREVYERITGKVPFPQTDWNR